MDGLTYNINLGSQLTSEAEAAIFGGTLGFILSVGLACCIIAIIAWWKIFEKAGEKGWKALIPVYNTYILFKICGLKNWFWAFLGVTILASILSSINPPVASTATVNFLGSSLEVSSTVDINYAEHIPWLIGCILACGVALAANIATAVKLAKAFKKEAGFVLGLIFLPFIFYLILAFGKAKYDKNVQKD